MNYANIKPETIETLRRYADHGIPTGDFLRAVLENNLFEAAGRADPENFAALGDICGYVYNEMPAGCWGNPQTVREWLRGFEIKRQVEQAQVQLTEALAEEAP